MNWFQKIKGFSKAWLYATITRRHIIVKVVDVVETFSDFSQVSFETRIVFPGKDCTRDSLRLVRNTDFLTLESLALQIAMKWRLDFELAPCAVFFIYENKKYGYLMKGW